MKKHFFTIIKWFAALYAIGYIIIGYPNDTFMMRAMNSVMLTIFSVSLFIYLFHWLDKKTQKVPRKS